MMIDQHVHSKISHDGISTIEEHMTYAKEKGIDEITFTEHYDDYTGLETNIKTLDVCNYRMEYLNNKNDDIVKTNFGIEINTSGIRYGLGTPHPNIEIIKRYKELGGKIITIGSDAHKSSDLVSNFDVVYDMLDEVGFGEITVYHDRVPQFVKTRK